MGRRSLSLFLIRYEAVLQEKEELEEAFESFKQEMMLTQEGAASKEIRILKKVIKNLEVGKDWNQKLIVRANLFLSRIGGSYKGTL